MKVRLFLFLAAIALVALIGWRFTQKRAELQAQTGQRAMRMNMAPVVSIAKARIGDVPRVFADVGSVEAPLSVKLATKVAGRVTYLTVHEGDRVRRGQVLVRIDPAEVEAEVRQARAALAEQQYRLAQARITQDPATVSVVTQVRQQEAALASARADADQVQANFSAQVEAAQAEVDSATANVRSAEANLANVRARCSRAEALAAKGYISTQELEDARTAVGVAEAAVEAATARRAAAEKQVAIVRTRGQADIHAAQAKVKQAAAALEYARANTVQTSAYRQSVAALQAAVAAAQAGVRSAEARRADTVLLAPFDGFVTSRLLDPGAMATPGQPILALQYMRQVWVTVSVPEEISGRICTGQRAEVTLDSVPGRHFFGKVTQVNAAADPQSRQVSVRVTLDNPDFAIRPGTYAHVAISTGVTHGALLVPREAVQQDREGSYVMVVDNRAQVHRRLVRTEDGGAADIAVTSGLEPGETVVTMSAMPLREGMAVRTGPGGDRRRPEGRRRGAPGSAR